MYSTRKSKKKNAQEAIQLIGSPPKTQKKSYEGKLNNEH